MLISIENTTTQKIRWYHVSNDSYNISLYGVWIISFWCTSFTKNIMLEISSKIGSHFNLSPSNFDLMGFTIVKWLSRYISWLVVFFVVCEDYKGTSWVQNHI